MSGNIILIGMMGCGKSTVGAILAQRLGLELVDTDSLIEAREERSIPEIFAADGEDYFRSCELGVALELAEKRGMVIACGGGLPMRMDCIAPLKQSGTVVFLCRDPGESYDTVPMDGRPLAQDGRAAFLARFAQRESIYRQWADCVITEFSSPEATVEAVLEAVR